MDVIYSILNCACISVIIVFIFYLYCCHKLSYWRRRGVQQLNNTHFLFGNFKNAILFRTGPGSHLGSIYGAAPPDAPYVGFYIFHKPCLLLRDPKIIKQILVRDFDKFTDRHFAGLGQKDSLGMVNLFGLNNPTWKYLRNKITPTLTRSRLRRMLPRMMETSEPMMAYLNKNINNGPKVIDAEDINNKFTADLIANVALGTKTDCFNYPYSDYCKFSMNFFHSFKRMIALVTVFFIPELVNIVGSPILFDSSFARDIFWQALSSREKSGEQRGDFIDSICELKNGEQNPLYKFEGENLFYQSGIFFSGFESSSTGTAFTLLELAKNKQYQDRARADIKYAIDQYGWTIEAFNHMKFLDRCIAEGLRLYPSISTIDRYALQDYKIPDTDVTIEKGTPIFISLFGLHIDPKFFDEPKSYNPDRVPDNGVMSEAYMPFGIGPRKCIGVKIGQLHIKMVLSKILLEYEVYQDPKEVNNLDSRATFTAPANGLNIQFSRLTQ